MSESSKPTKDTRAALLVSAMDVFAAKGYHEATIAEICERAGANVAAVNYHFRSKENLYVEAWRQGFERVAAAHPADGGVPADAPPEQRLRGRVTALLRRFEDPNNRALEIVHKEIRNPTGLLREMMGKCIVPMHEAMFAVVKELLGPAVPADRAVMCTRGLLAQCVHMRMPPIWRDRAELRPTMLAGSLRMACSTEALSEHIVDFSLAGIRYLRQAYEGAITDESERSVE